jgi:hypothetical protein
MLKLEERKSAILLIHRFADSQKLKSAIQIIRSRPKITENARQFLACPLLRKKNVLLDDVLSFLSLK